MERTGLLAFFLVAITDIISVISIFIPGSPFLSWISDDEKHELTDKTETNINDNFDLQNESQKEAAFPSGGHGGLTGISVFYWLTAAAAAPGA